MSIELFGKQVSVRETGCDFWKDKASKVVTPYINLSIQLNTVCNGNCRFCEYHDNIIKAFNYSKLAEIVSEINRKTRMFKLNFTGGEPTLDMKHFEKVLYICDDGFQGELGEFTVNTNGIHLIELIPFMDKISYIALSRHHWDDSINNDIFGTDTVAQSRDIKDFFNHFDGKHFKIHARCNLIKGYIDTPDKMATYLDNSMELGISWFGFVTLINLNQYCRENEVGADKLLSDSRFGQTQLWERYEDDKLECQCANYIYVSSGRLALLYHRIFCNSALNAGQIVYDGQNLRLGFGGDIIY